MAWVRPRRSRPGQEGADACTSGGTGGSSLPGGGPAALGGGDTGLRRRRGARRPPFIDATARCHRCHNTVANDLRKRPSPACQWLPVAVVISSWGQSVNPTPFPCGHLEKYRFTLKHRLRLMSWPASALGSGRGKADFSRCPCPIRQISHLNLA